jgi:hypothetical protein
MHAMACLSPAALQLQKRSLCRKIALTGRLLAFFAVTGRKFGASGLQAQRNLLRFAIRHYKAGF